MGSIYQANPDFIRLSQLERLDLFDNPVGYLTSLGKMLRILLFSAKFVQKLKFLNNSII
jgi:hypothetical protein